ncbi:MAG: hypothetical protein ACK4S4_14250 [Pyrinomonadaceae bacterium]
MPQLNAPFTDACPKCGFHRIVHYDDLTDDERRLTESLPGSAIYKKEDRKMHRFCTRCWHEFPEREILV